VPFTLINIKEDLEDIGPRFDGAPDLEFRAATKALELERSALSYQRVPPGHRFPYGHTHMKQEEVYVVLRGSGRMKVDDDFIERSAGIQLMRAALPEERLDPGEVIQDHRSFHWSLPVVVRRPARDPVEDHVGGGAEQDDRVETVVELRLVPHAPLNEERATIIGVQQHRDPFLDPEPLPPVQLVGGLNILPILAPARIIGVYDAIAASA
jgi:hypothetical protein